VAEPLFSLRGVEVARAGVDVLRGVDLDVAVGATGLVGPSGSGKSTLLRLLNRLADPARGRVRYRGGDVRELDPLDLRRRVVLVPQLATPLPGSVSENVRAARAFSSRAPEPDVAASLRLAGLDPGFARRPADELSVGEQQRVMLARALALDPDVLLLDEPTSALDEAARTDVETTLLACKRELAMSMVVVTHDRAQADRLTDRIVSLEGGQVVGAR
jgi:putative ABC transport system ATP-binding protein